MLEALRSYLEPLRERRNDPEALFFGSDALSAFEPRSTERRARKALKKANEKRVAESGEEELAPVEWFGLHEARHSFSTFMDHAGISETRADRYMGHAAPGVAGRYRHLLPGQIAEDASRLDEYLSGATVGKVVEMKRPAVG
jgi:integrase